MKGSYILLIELASNKNILIGKLGCISFPKAFYAYVGSAMNGLETRLAHHLRKEKRTHWHIDYFLSQSEIIGIILCPSEPFASCYSAFSPVVIASKAKQSHSAQGKLREECLLAHALANEFQFVPSFGCSDCRWNSHLYFDADLNELEAGIETACKSIRPGVILRVSRSPALSLPKDARTATEESQRLPVRPR
jgi:Uri superfamily endonuclease